MTSAPAAAAVRAPRARRTRVLAVLGGCVALAAAGVWFGAGATPGWWNPHPDTGAAALEAARQLEQGVASEMSRVRGPGAQPWRVRVRMADVNAWFAARLPQWLEHDRSLAWPAGVGLPQAAVVDGGVVLGAAYGGRVASTLWRVDPAVGTGPAMLVPDGARLGVLPVPFGGSVGEWFVPELATALALEVRLGDGRTVRVTGAEFGEGEVVLDCVTVGP